MKFRTYHEVAGGDASRLGEQVAAQRNRIRERLRGVRHVVGVMSGKGGVGKSYLTAAMAAGLAPRLPQGVGVLDGDLKSPTAARLLGATGPLHLDADGVDPAVGHGGVKVFSMDLLLEEGRPLRWREPGTERFIWRGVLETGALREFLADVRWGALDLLLVDLPPGVDHLEDLAELVPDLTGAIAVTIPSEESRRSVERAMHAARESKVRLLGVVENMSGYACAECGSTGPLFPGEAGAALARSFGVPLLDRVPFRATPPEASRLATLTDALLAVLP
jgi:ATP-binding protein involved in chromosome partitioning